MPLFTYRGIDAPGSLEKRPAAREAHLAHIGETEGISARFGGPLLDAEGNPQGSLVIFEAPDFAAAEAFAQADPYLAAGVFDRVEVFATKAVITND